MAIDNIIAAGIQPTTQLVSPLQTIGGLMQLRGQMTENALRSAQVEEVKQRQQLVQAEQTQKNRDLTDQNTIQALSPEDHAKLYSGDLSVLHGKVQPTTIQNVQKAVDSHINQLATNDKLKLENQAGALGQLKETAINIGAPMADGSAPDAATINSRYQSARQGIAPLLKLAGIEAPLPATISTPEELRNVQVQLHAAESAVTSALNRKKANAEADKAIADVDKAKADAAIAGKKNVGTNEQGLNPTDLAAIDQHNATIANLKATLPKAQADAAIAQQEAQFRAQHNGLSANEMRTAQYQQGELAIRQKELALKSGGIPLTPQQQSIADKLASGDFNPAQLARLPDKEAILAGAIAKGWNQSTYDTKQAFDNPKNKQSQNLGTISRIVGHIGRFEENSAKMGTDPIYGMAGANLTGLQKSLSEDSHAIAAELEKLVSGGVGTEGQIKQWQSDLRSSFSGVREKAIEEISKLAGSQFESMNQTYKTGTGKDLPLEKYVTGEGRNWLQKNGINVSGAAGGSQVPHVKTKAEFDALPTGAIYTEDDGKQYRKP